jgi:hypothetical protein
VPQQPRAFAEIDERLESVLVAGEVRPPLTEFRRVLDVVIPRIDALGLVLGAAGLRRGNQEDEQANEQ